MASADMGGSMLSSVLYLHIRWKYITHCLMIFSRKGGVQFNSLHCLERSRINCAQWSVGFAQRAFLASPSKIYRHRAWHICDT